MKANSGHLLLAFTLLFSVLSALSSSTPKEASYFHNCNPKPCEDMPTGKDLVLVDTKLWNELGGEEGACGKSLKVSCKRGSSAMDSCKWNPFRFETMFGVKVRVAGHYDKGTEQTDMLLHHSVYKRIANQDVGDGLISVSYKIRTD